MEEAIVMKIIIGLTIITILGFIYLYRENKALELMNKYKLFVITGSTLNKTTERNKTIC